MKRGPTWVIAASDLRHTLDHSQWGVLLRRGCILPKWGLGGLVGWPRGLGRWALAMEAMAAVIDGCEWGALGEYSRRTN